MNDQKKNGGIGWTKVPRWNSETASFDTLTGATWNPISGCYHNCEWVMPDGSTAGCYAKSIAEGLAASAYPHGFKHCYLHHKRLEEPLKQKKPRGIFAGSMADIFGVWVGYDWINTLLHVMRQAHWHTFMILTKNPARLAEFNPYPPNVWVGASLPATNTSMADTPALATWQTLDHLSNVDATVRFLSAEPLWFDAAPILLNYAKWAGRGLPIEWMILGAASQGAKTIQPRTEWAWGMIDIADSAKIPVYVKSNMHILHNRVFDYRDPGFPMIGGE